MWCGTLAVFPGVVQLEERLIWQDDRMVMSEGSSQGQLITVMSSNLIVATRVQEAGRSSRLTRTIRHIQQFFH